MSKLERMAAMFAKEMVEHNLMNGATRLDLDYIAQESCDLAYKIYEKAKEYKKPKEVKTLSRSDVKEMIAKEMHPTESTPKLTPPHHYPQ